MKAASLYMQDSPDGRDDAGYSDEWLMGQVADGEVWAYEALVTRHLDRFLWVARRIVGVQAEAEDIVQEAFLRLWTKAGVWAPQGAKFTTWFYRIVTNLSIDHKRKKRPVALPDHFDAPDPAQTAEAKLVDEQDNMIVARALDTLPERQKAAIVLCYYEGLSNAEAADVLSVGVKGLESLLVRGRRQLATILKDSKDHLVKEGVL